MVNRAKVNHNDAANVDVVYSNVLFTDHPVLVVNVFLKTPGRIFLFHQSGQTCVNYTVTG